MRFIFEMYMILGFKSLVLYTNLAKFGNFDKTILTRNTLRELWLQTRVNFRY